MKGHKNERRKIIVRDYTGGGMEWNDDSDSFCWKEWKNIFLVSRGSLGDFIKTFMDPLNRLGVSCLLSKHDFGLKKLEKNHLNLEALL